MPAGNLEELYFGEWLDPRDDLSYLTTADIAQYFDTERPSGPDGAKSHKVGKNGMRLAWSDFGTGDFRSPSYVLRYPDGSTVAPVKYRGHLIMHGKPALPEPMPQIRTFGPEDDKNVETLMMCMWDEFTGFEIDLYFTVFRGNNAIVRRSVFKNRIGMRGVGGTREQWVERPMYILFFFTFFLHICALLL